MRTILTIIDFCYGALYLMQGIVRNDERIHPAIRWTAYAVVIVGGVTIVAVAHGKIW